MYRYNTSNQIKPAIRVRSERKYFSESIKENVSIVLHLC